MDSVEQTLRRIGPCVSTQLVEALVSEYGLTPVAARQRVSRNKTIRRLAFLPFQRNARFVYLQSDYASPKFWRGLASALLENSIAHGGALAALMARGGIMPRVHFDIACGAPIAQRGHLSPATILDRLEQAGLVQSIDIAGVGACVQLSHQVDASSLEVARMRARLKSEQILLLAIKAWARNLGLVSYDKVAIRDENSERGQPRVGTFAWDLTGPSYVAPMIDWSSGAPKPGFLACDVLLNAAVTGTHLKPFLNKCKTLRSLTKVGRCLQLFVAEGYEPEAFGLARAAGVVPATTSSLFGDEVAQALTVLTELLSETFLRPDTVELLDLVLSRLTKIEGAAINLRGALFEFIVAELVRRSSVVSEVQMNEFFRDDQGRSAEVDVLVVRRGHSVRFIECRGYKPGGEVPDAMVDRWLDNRIPMLREAAHFERSWRGLDLVFEFWTSGQLSEKAKARIQEVQTTVRPGKYTVCLIEGDELRALAKSIGDSALLKTLNEHYFEHPLEAANRKLRKREATGRLRAQSQLVRR
ncbi:MULTISPECIES: hypothetical protein [Cupriavidus]|uniref:NERD domain-containing protein n=1 Tax=Cupriavidus metallidurans TaxID=119219 RepID=A0A482IQ47_9BURK|nr:MULTISPECIES: hypothetical protein [Cupriavidus]QBP10042.1 hypothetical protein DDF84_009840 [Cupriavidus metallidurans]